MRVSESVNELLPALAKVKESMGVVLKSSSNPFFKSKYADLNAHLDVVEPLLASNGLLLTQPVDNTENGNVVESTIYHVASGQYITSSMKLVGEADMQKIGSGVTYARRYTLGALLGMKSDDDDANAVSGKAKSKSTYTPKKTASPASRPSFSKSAAKSVQTSFEDEDGL
jgi:hypothetical protein